MRPPTIRYTAFIVSVFFCVLWFAHAHSDHTHTRTHTYTHTHARATGSHARTLWRTHAHVYARTHARTPHRRWRAPSAARPPIHRQRVHNGRRRCFGITLLHHPNPFPRCRVSPQRRSPFVQHTAAAAPHRCRSSRRRRRRRVYNTKQNYKI